VTVFILDFANQLYKYLATEIDLAYDLLTAIITPLTFAVTMTVLYYFIFELARIRLLLILVDYDKKFKQLAVIRGTCIFLTFTPVVLLAIINLNFNLPVDKRFLTDEGQQGLRVTSGLAKLLVDTYIYWSLSQSLAYLYKEYRENYLKQS